MTAIGPEVGSSGVRAITSKEFSAFQKLIYDEAGILLSDAKRALLVGRLNRRLRDLGLTTFSAYLQRVQDDSAERVQMLDCICTNETHFFREPAHFDYISDQLAPRWKREAAAGLRGKRVRVWSAGCSTGEEPYSVAMLLLELLGDWDIDIVGSDLSTKVLGRAVAGLWPLEKSSEIPPRYLRKYMLRGTRTQEGWMKAGPALRAVVTFQQINLNEDRYPLIGRFDLVFCRNVMIYFDGDAKRRITARLLDKLTPDGLIFVGHSESLGSITDRVRTVVPTVYQLAGAAR